MRHWALFGFTHFNLRRIEALIEPANVPSQNLIKKHGFVEEGLLRSYEFTCGKFDDLYIYSLLKQDFEKFQAHEYLENGIKNTNSMMTDKEKMYGPF